MGCVQEEILFLIKPECLVSLQLCAKMDPNESIVISGAEQFSRYEGYASSFKYAGPFIPDSPAIPMNHDLDCLDQHIIAIDAVVSFHCNQFSEEMILRDLQKAYAGFSSSAQSLPEVVEYIATGNWGCGAFGGNRALKFFEQLMAATAAGRGLDYYLFEAKNKEIEYQETFDALVSNHVTVGDLFQLVVALPFDSRVESKILSFVRSHFSSPK